MVFANNLKDKIYSLFGFTVNIGIANNKLCAKMASDFLKPNMVHTLYSNEVSSKMWPLPIEDLFMVGKSSSSKLRMIGINTIGDLANCDAYFLSRYFKNYDDLIKRANGIDDSVVDSSLFEAKGISNEITLLISLIYIIIYLILVRRFLQGLNLMGSMLMLFVLYLRIIFLRGGLIKLKLRILFAIMRIYFVLVKGFLMKCGVMVI